MLVGGRGGLFFAAYMSREVGAGGPGAARTRPASAPPDVQYAPYMQRSQAVLDVLEARVDVHSASATATEPFPSLAWPRIEIRSRAAALLWVKNVMPPSVMRRAKPAETLLLGHS